MFQEYHKNLQLRKQLGKLKTNNGKYRQEKKEKMEQ